MFIKIFKNRRNCKGKLKHLTKELFIALSPQNVQDNYLNYFLCQTMLSIKTFNKNIKKHQNYENDDFANGEAETGGVIFLFIYFNNFFALI